MSHCSKCCIEQMFPHSCQSILLLNQPQCVHLTSILTPTVSKLTLLTASYTTVAALEALQTVSSKRKFYIRKCVYLQCIRIQLLLVFIYGFPSKNLVFRIHTYVLSADVPHMHTTYYMHHMYVHARAYPTPCSSAHPYAFPTE